MGGDRRGEEGWPERWEKKIKNVEAQKPFFKQEGIIKTVKHCLGVKQSKNYEASISLSNTGRELIKKKKTITCGLKRANMLMTQ